MKKLKHHWERHKKKYIIVLLLVVLLLTPIVYKELKANLSPIKISGNSDVVAQYHVSISDSKPIIDVCGVNFLLDTGNAGPGQITPESLQKFESIGVSTSSEWCLWGAINALNGIKIYTTLVCMSLPSADGKVLDGEWFYKTDNDHENVIGWATLKQFIVEWKPSKDSIYFRKNIPEGYSLLNQMKTKRVCRSLIVGLPFVDLEVNGQTQEYFMDSGRGGVFVQLPVSDTIYCDSIVFNASDTLRSGHSRRFVEAYRSKGEVIFNNNSSVIGSTFYAESNFTYNFNPFALYEFLKMMKLDVVFDFKGNAIYWRKAM